VTVNGAYSLVRYVEDVERGEGKNVGVLLSVDEETVPKFLDRDDLRELNEVVRRFAGLVDHIIETETQETDEVHGLLRELSTRRFPHFEITEPRLIRIDTGVAEILDDLARRLVDEPHGSPAIH
jgi:DUF3037 family protein